jgi:flagellar export protein FliJ
MNAPRACWTVLAQKAEDQVSLIQAEMAQGRARLLSLQASRERLQKLYEEYQKPAANPDASAGMQGTMNQRQFSSQLLTLMDRVQQDLAQTETALKHCRVRLNEAERERLKMQSLVDQDLSAFNAHTKRREQRQMDDLGVLQFNFQSR